MRFCFLNCKKILSDSLEHIAWIHKLLTDQSYTQSVCFLKRFFWTNRSLCRHERKKCLLVVAGSVPLKDRRTEEHMAILFARSYYFKKKNIVS